MPKLYLRLSRYVAAFIRAIGDGQSLPYDTPVEFSPYTEQYVVLTSGLRVVPEEQQHRASCYSQSAWRNMQRGCLPQGGRPLIRRNAADYLTYSEVCTLEHVPATAKASSYEFVCIGLPREVWTGNRVERVSSSHTLDTRAAARLRRVLREDFIRTFLDFEARNRTFASSQGINRTDVEVMERFFMEYDMPVSHDQRERESLRRLVQRWRQEASTFANRKEIIGDELVARIDAHELARANRHLV